MNFLVLLAEANSGGQIQQIANTFGVDWPHLISQIISFAIVCLLLQRFAYKPILRTLDERRQQIAQGIAEREKIKRELAQAETRRQEIMLQADTDATKVIEEAHTAAASVREKETQKAIAAAEQIIGKSHEAALQERAHMLRELKQELGALVVQATAVATRKVLTAEDQRRMAEETLKQLGKAA
jgi:F-type H+-transporting ATPase subunit b